MEAIRPNAYIWGGLTSQNRSGVSSFYGYDSQGSVRILTNSAGAVTDSYVYTAFGVELLNGSGTVNPFRYVGLYGYYITFINLYYVRARWLDAVKGRWDSRDPIGFGGGSYNIQKYVGNDPATNFDPAGLYTFGQSCNEQAKTALRKVLDPMCSALKTADPLAEQLPPLSSMFARSYWCAANSCVQKEAKQPGNQLLGQYPGLTNCQAHCMRRWCDVGIIECTNSKNECDRLMRGSAAWVSRASRTCNSLDAGIGGATNEAKTIHVCTPLAIKNGNWDTDFGCIGQIGQIRRDPLNKDDHYIGCRQGCNGKEGIFYLLHELQHICPAPGENGHGEMQADAQACCILHNVPGF